MNTAPHAPARQAPAFDDRPLKPALLRGWARQCPACGRGPLMAGYLRVAPTCTGCGSEFHHHRADDGPAYVTILIVGKVVMAVYLAVFLAWQPPPLVMIALCWSLAIGLALWLLPRIKGAMVALQWSRRMDGFATAADAARDLSPAPAQAMTRGT